MSVRALYGSDRIRANAGGGRKRAHRPSFLRTGSVAEIAEKTAERGGVEPRMDADERGSEGIRSTPAAAGWHEG
jgi:hypothetical protein